MIFEVSFYCILFVISFVLTYYVRKIAIKRSILDIPNNRSSHAIPTPRGGGLAVAITWFLGVIAFFFWGLIPQPLFWALMAGIPLVVVGLLDDVFTLKASTRFWVQIACAALALVALRNTISLNTGLFEVTEFWIIVPFAFLLIVWFVNLFNFLDGIDGHIGTEIVFLGIASALLFKSPVGLILAISTFGFLIWNWQKAKIFMGDVGSTLLGFNIAILALYQQDAHTTSTISWIILTSVFWFDATLTLFRRWRNHEKLSEAHRKHGYQRIVLAGFSHQKTVLWALALNLIGFGLAYLSEKYSTFSILFLIIDLAMLYWVMSRIDRLKPFPKK